MSLRSARKPWGLNVCEVQDAEGLPTASTARAALRIAGLGVVVMALALGGSASGGAASPRIHVTTGVVGGRGQIHHVGDQLEYQALTFDSVTHKTLPAQSVSFALLASGRVLALPSRALTPDFWSGQIATPRGLAGRAYVRATAVVAGRRITGTSLPFTIRDLLGLCASVTPPPEGITPSRWRAERLTSLQMDMSLPPLDLRLLSQWICTGRSFALVAPRLLPQVAQRRTGVRGPFQVRWS